MASAAARCFDSLFSWSSVRSSSCWIAPSVPTWYCIRDCRCFATARSLDGGFPQKFPTFPYAPRYGREIRTRRTERGMEAAWPVSRGESDGGGLPAAARGVLDRIVRLGCRTLGADEIVVLVRGGRDHDPPPP